MIKNLNLKKPTDGEKTKSVFINRADVEVLRTNQQKQTEKSEDFV